MKSRGAKFSRENQILLGVNRAFGDEDFEPYIISDFRDHTISTAYKEVVADFAKIPSSVDPSAEKELSGLLDEARTKRGTDKRKDRIRAACIYLRYAQLLGEHEPYADQPTAAEAYHYAANEFRQLDLLDRTAQCYFNSALSAFCTSNAIPVTEREKALKPLSLALRSAGRAKALYISLGDNLRSDRAHQLRQEVSRREFRLRGNYMWILLYIWKFATGYGTSSHRWFSALLLSLIVFALLYSVGFAACYVKLANDAPSFSIITPIYVSLLNLFQFGTYTQLVPLHWSAQLVLMFHGVVAFVLIGTGVTFLTRK
jgi:hypothetical protein